MGDVVGRGLTPHLLLAGAQHVGADPVLDDRAVQQPGGFEHRARHERSADLIDRVARRYLRERRQWPLLVHERCAITAIDEQMMLPSRETAESEYQDAHRRQGLHIHSKTTFSRSWRTFLVALRVSKTMAACFTTKSQSISS